MSITLVALGGALGAVSRYFIGHFIMSKRKTSSMPIAMVIVNLVGSLTLGITVGLYLPSENPLNDSLYLLFNIGFFGAFTTFSTFSVEAMQLLHKHRYKDFWIYVLVSIMGSVILFGLALYILTV
ncbi:fluoride efflux transporter CrcB [Alkalibacillus silvisoli]|uniref:Fluoride-specific ion channel FluC n=1 Tax=Alkalibacillus silvisoli TaxID=392823 RepID=A0ABP3JR89_9BACI